MMFRFFDSLGRGGLNSVSRSLQQIGGRTRFSHPGRRPLRLEPLEQRRLLATIYVDVDATAGNNTGDSWLNAYTDLQSALGAATSGDEIWVAAGKYTPTSGSDRTVSFTLKSGVGVYGGFNGDELDLADRDVETNVTTLSGDIGVQDDTSDNSYHVVYASGVTDAVLNGLTITGGNSDGGSNPNYHGAGMYNLSSTVTLTNVIFSGNSADSYGAGMYSVSSTATLTNVTFSGNSADSGGGGMYNYYSTATLTNVTFSGNAGGGMLSYYTPMTLTDVTFSGNSGGGGLINFSNCTATLTNVTFSGNSASHGGGMANSSSTVTLTNVTFSDNSAASHGGGMFNSSSTATLTNVTFSGNSATYAGGGMENYFNSTATLTNVTFSGNSATGASNSQGGGMVNYNSTATLTNSILWGNTAPTGPEIYENSSSTTTVTYSIVEGGWTGAGNLNQDPLFVDAASGDLRLQPGSPAIDAGNDAAVPADAADLDGDGDTTESTPLDLGMAPRFVGAAVDMGAYEVQNAPPVADDQSVTANEDTATPITLTATDPDEDDVTFSIVSYPAHGTLTDFDPATGAVVYTPDADYDGDDSFTFMANDGTADSNEATVSIAVLSAEDQTETMIDEVFQWVDEGFLDSGECSGLVSNLDSAIAQLEDGKAAPAVNKLEAFENKIEALVKSGRVSAEEAEAVLALADAAIHSIQAGSEAATAAAFADPNDDATEDPLAGSLLADLVSVGTSKTGNGPK